jgi:hypothetical protein
MSIAEVVRDHPPMPIAPEDKSVIIPESVRRAAAAAEAIHKQAYQPQDISPQPDPAAVVPPLQPDPQPQPQPQPAEPVVQPTKEELHDQSNPWISRYNSMKGRWEQSQVTIGQLQEQMSGLGDELQRAQTAIEQLRAGAHQPASGQPQPQNGLLRPEDEQQWGSDLIDFTQRAAKAAVQPELDRLTSENQRLQRAAAQTGQQAIEQYLDGNVTDWRTIDKSPEFKAWLRLPDLYSGVVRGRLMNKAARAGNAPQVAEFFRGYLSQVQSTSAPLAPQPEPTAQPQPRSAAVPLETLAAPGRARPAAGDSQQPADKPSFTRTQIARFYDDVRRGVYSGRETEKANLEASIFQAQREGRVR